MCQPTELICVKHGEHQKSVESAHRARRGLGSASSNPQHLWGTQDLQYWKAYTQARHGQHVTFIEGIPLTSWLTWTRYAVLGQE